VRPAVMRGGAAGAVLLAWLGCVATVHAAGEEAAVAVVERLHAALVENVSAEPPRGFEQRLARLEPVIEASFDFGTITRVALGDAYEGLEEARRERFRELIERQSALTYADRFEGGGEPIRFVTGEVRAVRGGRTLVRTRLEPDSGEPVTLDYVLHETGDGVRIVNVLANGVSDLSLKRAEYAAVIRSDGVDGLLERVEQQVKDLAARAAGSQ